MSCLISEKDRLQNLDVECDIYVYERLRELADRRMYLYGSIRSMQEEEVEKEGCTTYYDASKMSKLIEYIIEFNRMDREIVPAKRKPIILFINSPGGDVTEGFALISAMKLSKTPIYTVNVGEWCSMAFLIGITGTKRLSLDNAIFMMHEPSGLTVGKFSDMQDKVDFNRKYNNQIIKKHVMSHSKMKPAKYNAISKKDFYMLPDEALKYGFIDGIVSDIDSITDTKAEL